MMSLESAIKHCEEVAETEEQKYKDWKGDYSHLKKIDSCLECANEHRQLADWLKELEKLREIPDNLEQTRWIPCSERLPEKSDRYWCTFGGTNLTGIDYYTTEAEAKELFENPEKYVGWQSQNVIAWMPLPEPYEGE